MRLLSNSIVETDINRLHKVSKDIDISDLKLINTIESRLLDTFNRLDRKLQGVSGVQVGYPYRVFLVRWSANSEPEIIYNPKVLISVGSKKSNEGCLSEGDKRYIVKRPILVKVQYETKFREVKVEWLPYRKARIFMHEYDHLNGVLLQDKGVLVDG